MQINRNGLRAIAIGSGENNALLLQHLPRPLITDSNLPNDAHILEGDLVVTSGLGRRFPRDYPVGEIEAIIQSAKESSARVIIKPFAEFDQIREVLMVWPNEYKNND